MKNTRKHILLSFAVLMMTMTACGQVNDDKTESRKSSASSNVDSSSSESDSSKSDSKTTTTTTASKATSSVTTTSIVTVTDAKGNLLSKISIDENGKVITLDKDGKPKTTTTTKKTTNKTGSTSSGGTATTTRKTTSGGGSSTSYTSNSGNNNSGGYSNGNSGSYDNSYSNDNNNSGNSGNSNSGNSGNNNSSSNNNQQQQTEQQTQAPEPEPAPSIDYSNLIERWLASDYKTGTADPKTKDDYINIGRGLSNDGSDLSKAKAVYKYMLTTYKNERPGVNCISYASATYALCKGIGLDCRYIMYSDWYNHVSTAVYVDDGWYNMDTNCASNSGWSENEIRLFENNKNGMDYTQICDEYENYGNISCLSKSNYFEYCEKINGYTCIYPLSEDEAVEYHRTGKLPQHVLDDIEFDKQTL